MAQIRSLHDLLQTAYGVKTVSRENHVVSQVGVIATKIASNNPRRVGLVIVNHSAGATIRIAPSKDISSTRGIALAGSGAAVALRWDQDFDTVADEWYAISSAAASDIYVLEIMIESNTDTE